MSKKINILMFNMSSYYEWNIGTSNRNYHILQKLIADDRIDNIIAVDYLPWTFKKVIKSYFFAILDFKNRNNIIYKSLFTRARYYNDKLIVVSSVANFFRKKLFYKELHDILELTKIEDYICWSYNPMEVDFFDNCKAQAYIFDAVDDWTLHPSYQSIISRLTDNYKLIEKKADIVFTVAEQLKSLFNDNANVYWVPNGIDYNFYQENNNLIDKSIADIKHPIIGYLGIILERLDTDIIKYIAEHNPDKSIVLAGSVWSEKIKNELDQYKNIYFTGFISYKKAPMYISQFDVGIIPHRLDTYVSSTNPMKMYEYLACGKPVVTTSAPGVDMFEGIYTADDPVTFNDAINKALQKNSEADIARRKEMVKEHTWKKRVNKMIDIIYEQVIS